MRTLPNMRVADPGDATELVGVMTASLEIDGPVYYRVPKFALPRLFNDGHRFEWRGTILVPGGDVSIFTSGMMTHIGLQAAELLTKDGISAEVVHLSSIKPIDEALITESVARTGCAVTAEIHSVYGGLGSAVAEVLTERCPAWLRRIGFQDKWMHSGSIGQVLATYGLLASDIAKAARDVMLARGNGIGPGPDGRHLSADVGASVKG